MMNLLSGRSETETKVSLISARYAYSLKFAPGWVRFNLAVI
jgi:hypothetical protein